MWPPRRKKIFQDNQELWSGDKAEERLERVRRKKRSFQGL
jgi:hypothetical protein